MNVLTFWLIRSLKMIDLVNKGFPGSCVFNFMLLIHSEACMAMLCTHVHQCALAIARWHGDREGREGPRGQTYAGQGPTPNPRGPRKTTQRFREYSSLQGLLTAVRLNWVGCARTGWSLQSDLIQRIRSSPPKYSLSSYILQNIFLRSLLQTSKGCV